MNINPNLAAEGARVALANSTSCKDGYVIPATNS